MKNRRKPWKNRHQTVKKSAPKIHHFFTVSCSPFTSSWFWGIHNCKIYMLLTCRKRFRSSNVSFSSTLCIIEHYSIESQRGVCQSWGLQRGTEADLLMCPLESPWVHPWKRPQCALWSATEHPLMRLKASFCGVPLKEPHDVPPRSPPLLQSRALGRPPRP